MSTAVLTKAETAVVYGRSSSASEKSINDQIAENRTACVENGWTVAHELSDPVSASRYGTKIRENWQRILELLATVDVIVLWEPSRGDRTLSTWAAFLDACREHGVRIHAVSHHRTYDPRVARDYRTLAEDGVDATYESDRLRERVVRGMRAAEAAGLPSGKRDYGYQRVYEMRNGKMRPVRAVEHPDEGPVIRRIFADIASGVTMYRIAQRLDEEGVPTMRGARTWKPGVILGMAKNAIYRPHPDDPTRGCLVRNGKASVGTWPPLVNEETWQAVQAILGTNAKETRARRKASPPGAIKYLLSASQQLLTCAVCHGDIVGSSAAARPNSIYTCRLGHTGAPMEYADEHVTDLVVDKLSEPNARRLWVTDDAATKAARKELAELQSKLDEALALYEADEISGKAYSVKEKKLSPLIEDARRRAQPTGAPVAMLKLIDAAELGEEHVRPTWNALEIVAKREVVAAVFSKLELLPVGDTKIHRWHKPDQRLALVRERIVHEYRAPVAGSRRHRS